MAQTCLPNQAPLQSGGGDQITKRRMMINPGHGRTTQPVRVRSLILKPFQSCDTEI